MKPSVVLTLLVSFACSRPAESADPKVYEYDVVVYGGTSAGVIAAVQAKKMGKTAVVVGPDVHLGGLSSGGLGFTDTGNKQVIGGLSREFYQRVWQHYQKPEAWKQQKREEYGNQGQGTPAIDGDKKTMWIFEPHVAEAVFESFVADYEIPVFRDEWLERKSGVKMDGTKIVSIAMLSGKTFAGKIFIDATYEGDLMASAGVEYHVGREAKDVYDEEWNGVQTGVLHHGHHFGAVKTPISPYKIPGDPNSGVLPRISTEHPGEYGAGDNKVQAYCFRMCLTDDPTNRVPFPKPEGYDPAQYELLLRVLEAGWREAFRKFDPIPNHKTDTNNHGPFSTDNIGYNYDYPEATYERRKEIVREHEVYQQGLMYYLANEPRVPEDVRQVFAKWGLAKDEFTDNGNWPHQIYVREARRMIGLHVMTENELLKQRPTPEPIGMGSYTMDSHNVQRYITPEGYVQNEGDIGVSTRGPYSISRGSILPQKDQCENLVVPVCVSSSHIAFGSIRMEPVFMILGQSAATVGVMAIDSSAAVQDVPYEKLSERLLADGQVLSGNFAPAGAAGRSVAAKSLQGIVIDDADAKLTGDWSDGFTVGPWVGRSYIHDGNVEQGKKSALFETKLPESGTYEVRVSYTPHSNRASNALVIVETETGTKEIRIDQRKKPPLDDLLISVGEFHFDKTKPARVTISNEGSTGFVIVDAVQWLKK
ncbi:MAG TPA: FAD-dependent oxidoreductase [Planctomycetaceae bacterium]|nr:FAD-dependent oxidoreductase [Planctomycetaceae bacterium]